jgi:2'-5' RNA ligase
MARTRTFIAVDPGPAIRDRLTALQEELAGATEGIKWVEEENLHVTLQFIGEVGDRDLVAVCRAVEKTAAAQKQFALKVAGVGGFPNARRPRIVWAGITDGSAELIAVHAALIEPLEAIGCWRREERAYHPHLTLGRTKSDDPSEQLAKLLSKHESWTGGETTIREILVMASELTRQGPTYTVLSRAKLGK